MRLPRFYNLRFFLALPFALIANACADWIARQDDRAANALNTEADEL